MSRHTHRVRSITWPCRASMDLLKPRERFPHLTPIGNVSSHTIGTGHTRAGDR